MNQGIGYIQWNIQKTQNPLRMAENIFFAPNIPTMIGIEFNSHYYNARLKILIFGESKWQLSSSAEKFNHMMKARKRINQDL